MGIPELSASTEATEERLRLPAVGLSLPKIPRRKIQTQERQVTHLPRVERRGTQENLHSNVTRRPQVLFNSASASNFGISRIQGSRCMTAEVPTRCTNSLYKRVSQLNLSGRNKMTKTGGNTRPSTSTNIDMMKANYYEIKQANINKSPYLPTLPGMDDKRLQELKNSIHRMSSVRVNQFDSNVIPTQRPSTRGIPPIANSSLPQIPSYSLPDFQPVNKLKNSVKKTIPTTKLNKDVLSTYTVMDPGSQDELDFSATAKQVEKLNQSPTDKNNNFELNNPHSLSGSKTVRSKARKRRKNNSPTSENGNDVFSPAAMSQNYLRTLAGQRMNMKGKRISVQDLSLKMYGQLQNISLQKKCSGASGSYPIDERKDTLNRLKKAYAMLQQELDNLSVDENEISSKGKGLDFNKFEESQKRELASVRKSIHPYKDSFKGMTAADFRGELSIPLNQLTEIFTIPTIDKSMLPKKTSRAPKKIDLKPSMNLKIGPTRTLDPGSGTSRDPDKQMFSSRPTAANSSQTAIEGSKRRMVQQLIGSEGYKRHLQKRESSAKR